MNEKPIPISEFRRNTKVFLDAAKTNDVWLRRGDILYRVQYMGEIWKQPPTPKNEAIKPFEVKTGNVQAVVPDLQGHNSVDDLITSKWQPEKIASEPTAGVEKPCCLNEITPCKHWVWDINTGEGYSNSLSGRFREAE